MKNKLKSTLALLLTFCIMLSFTACDGGSSNKNTPDNSSVENETDNSDGKNKEDGVYVPVSKYWDGTIVVNTTYTTEYFPFYSIW